MGGQELTDIRSLDIKTRLNEGMTKLVEQVYTNLKDADYWIWWCNAWKNIINSTTSGALFGTDMDNCMTEVFNWINRNKSMSVRTKVKDLVEYFQNQFLWLVWNCIIVHLGQIVQNG